MQREQQRLIRRGELSSIVMLAIFYIDILEKRYVVSLA